MPTVHVYLNFNGNCEQAFNFYKSVFGGEFAHVSRFKDMPPMGDMKIPDSDAEKIMHMSLPIGKTSVLMGSDTPEGFGPPFNQGNNFSISISADSREQADQYYSALSKGGKTIMPMENTFWGSYFGMLADSFGINWMMSFGDGVEK